MIYKRSSRRSGSSGSGSHLGVGGIIDIYIK
jgi:hypothetical protein